MALNTPFRNLHALVSPTSATGTIVRIPGAAPARTSMDRGGHQPPPSEDLLGMSLSPAPARTEPQPADDIFGLNSPPAATSSAVQNGNVHSTAASDVFGMFDSLSVSGMQTPTSSSAPADPF